MIFTNQLREKVGVMFGNPETTSGGRALKFYSSIRIDIRRIQSIKAGGDLAGINKPYPDAITEALVTYFEGGSVTAPRGAGVSDSAARPSSSIRAACKGRSSEDGLPPLRDGCPQRAR
jgi:recombination protein RecA